MRFLRVAIVLLVLFVMSACSGTPQPTPQQIAATRKAAVEAKAQQKLGMYHKLVAMKNYELAVPIGDEIVNDFAHTKAAAEVDKTLPKLKATAAAKSEKMRLQRLWLYQVGPQSGGTQSTAAITASHPVGTGIRLILRRHSVWGESAYLFDDAGKGFVCKRQCSLHAHFDGHARAFTGYLPKGGEPAMFIKNDKGFIAELKKAKKITFEVHTQAKGRQTLEFEVGGFDPGKWKPVPKKK